MVFEVFRSRQKQMLIFLGLAAIFAFVLAQPLEQLITRLRGGGPDSSGPVVATIWGRPVYARQVYNIQQERNTVMGFFARAARRAGLMARQIPTFGTQESDVLQAIALEGKADRLGIVVTDDDIREYLSKDLFQNKLSARDYTELLAGASDDADGKQRRGGELTDDELFRILRREIKIQRAVVALLPSAIRDTPEQMWEDKAASLTHIRLEAVQLPVDKFAASVGKPEDADLKKIFEERKDIADDPENGAFGLKLPRKIDVQYLEASVDKFADAETVTEEEIKKYYEEHKTEFKRPEEAVPLNRNLPGPPTPPAPPLPKKSGETKAEEKPAAKTETKPESKPAVKSEPKPATPDAKSPKPESKPAESKPAESKTVEAKPAEKKPEAKPAESKPNATKPQEKPKAFSKPLSRLVLVAVAWLAEESKAAKPAEKSTPKPDSTPISKPADVAPKPADNKAEAKAPNTPAKPATKDVAPKVEAKPAEAKAADTKAESKATPAPEATRPPETLTLEEARPQIVKTLKRQKASQKLEQKLRDLLQEVFYPYSDQYQRELRKAQEKSSAPVDPTKLTLPSLPDFAEVAKKHGFELKTTGLVDYRAMTKIPGVGTARRIQSGGDELPEMVFMEASSGLFKGRIARERDGNAYYLFWKTKDVPAETPSFEQSKEKLTKFWEVQAAEPKAKEAAEKLAKDITAANGDIDKAISKDQTKITTDLFPRKQRVFQSNPFMFGDQFVSATIPEIPNAGDAFLDRVFQLKAGEVVALADQRKQNYYVVKLKDRSEADFSRFIGQYDAEMRGIRQPLFMNQLPQRQQQFMQLRLDVIEESNLKISGENRRSSGSTDLVEPSADDL